MKKIILIFVTLFLLMSSSNAQKINSCKEADADVIVFVTQYKNEADLIVYKCNFKSEAVGNNGRWFYVDNIADADKKVFFAEYKNEAEILIYFTNKKHLASWKNYSKKRLLQ